MKKIICVIDMQKDFIDGSLGSEKAVALIDPIVEYLNRNKNDAYFIFTKDIHDKNYLSTLEGKHCPINHCINFSLGSQLNSKISNFINKYDLKYKIVEKNYFGFGELNWKNKISELIKGKVQNMISEIELVGLYLDTGVLVNAIELKNLFPEIEISVIKNLCIGMSITKYESALNVLNSCQINIK